MNRNQAEIYVLKSLKTSKIISKKFQYQFLCINLILLLASFAFYENLAFIYFVLSVVGLYTLATIMIARKEPNFCAITFLGAIHLTIVCLAFNFLSYAIYQSLNSFVLWDFLVTISIQIVALFSSIPLVVCHVKKFKPKEGIAKSEVTAASVAGFTCALTTVLFRIFAPSILIAVTIMSVLTTMFGVFISYGIVVGFYKVYLIKKYNIEYVPEYETA